MLQFRFAGPVYARNTIAGYIYAKIPQLGMFMLHFPFAGLLHVKVCSARFFYIKFSCGACLC